MNPAPKGLVWSGPICLQDMPLKYLTLYSTQATLDAFEM